MTLISSALPPTEATGEAHFLASLKKFLLFSKLVTVVAEYASVS